MTTLYRLYRPRTFAEVVGQPHITETLKQAILKDKISHAYLFYGPRGTGKTTTARLLAKRLNCLDAKGAEPCGTCRLCKATQDNKNIDILEIDAASNRGIDDIRNLREGIGLSPSMGKYKVYIIDEVHMLTNEAFAALLKTLEEPVAHAVFILATTELHKVPATILSRCQVYRFRRATNEELRQRLTYLLQQEKRQADEEALQFIISRSDGCFRDAESLLGQMLTVQSGKISSNTLTDFLGLPPVDSIDRFLAALVRQEAQDAIAIIDELYAAGTDPEQFIKETIRVARDGALEVAKEEKNGAAFTPHPESSRLQARDEGASTSGIAEKSYSEGQGAGFTQEPRAGQLLPQIIRALLQASQDLAYVPQPVIALQLAVLTVCTKPSSFLPAAQKILSNEKEAGPVAPGSPPGLRPQSPEYGLSAPRPGSPSAPPVVKKSSPSRLIPPKASVSLSQVQSQWDNLIQAIQKENPVAATFLRATEPVATEGQTITIRMQFMLHRNYFEKPENKKMIEDTLTNLFNIPVTIRCQVEEAYAKTSLKDRRHQQEENLYQAVQEVFGPEKK